MSTPFFISESRMSEITDASQAADRYAIPVVKLWMLFLTLTIHPSSVVKSTWSSAVHHWENDRRYLDPVFLSMIFPSRTRENCAESKEPKYDGEYSEYSWFVPAMTRLDPRISKLVFAHSEASGVSRETASAQADGVRNAMKESESIASIVFFAILGLKMLLYGSILNPGIL
jgi:hypothetical protein